MSPSNADEPKAAPGGRRKTTRSRRTGGAKDDPATAKERAPRSSRAKGPSGPADEPGPSASRRERGVAVSRETLVKRVADVRRTSIVVLAFRAAGGAVITFLSWWFLLLVVSSLISFSRPGAWAVVVTFLLSTIVSMTLVLAARFATPRSLPGPASALAFLEDAVFAWVDPFREDRPHLLPMWLEAILWAPSQVLVGALPFLRIQWTGPADVEAAADVARRMSEEGEIDLTGGLPHGSAEAKGLRLLLLLRLARLAMEDGKLKGRVSGLGQAALFEGTVG